MKQPQHAPVRKSDALQRQASAHAGAHAGAPTSAHTGAPAGPRQTRQGEQIAQLQAAAPAQLAGGTVHHDPEKKKNLPRGLGKQQNQESAKALAIKKASPVPITNKEAKRQAKAAMASGTKGY